MWWKLKESSEIGKVQKKREKTCEKVLTIPLRSDIMNKLIRAGHRENGTEP